jgi:NADH dehydrogenase [ubiquinone] 1 alpha subcomplex assembly factor 7
MYRDVFGSKGDFITSPEISQLFGELIGIWYVHYYQSLKQAKTIRMVELGPGRGTLMYDVLQTVKQFPFLYDRIESISLVEASPHLQKLQQEKLSVFDKKMEWFDRIEDVPPSCSFYLAHEFFDALPVYQFIKKDGVIRELIVDLDQDPSVPEHFRVGVSTKKPVYQVDEKVELKEGDIMQVSPDLVHTVSVIAKNIKQHGGTSLIVDYGMNNIREDRVRGIQNHKIVSPFKEPGKVDLSTDVDFQAIQSVAEKQGIQAFGPLTQTQFLQRMGSAARMMTVLSHYKDADTRARIIKEYDRLVSPKEMGSIYKFQVLTNDDIPYPFGTQQ